MAKFRFVAFLVLVIASSHAFAWNEQFGNCLFMVAQLPIMKDPRIQEFLQRATRNAVGDKEGLSEIARLLRTLEGEGSPDALLSLSVLHEGGVCVEADQVKASSLLRKAAETGSADAQSYLGSRQTDCKEAIYWWEKAALVGDSTALKGLARTYHVGCPTVAKDPFLALMWLTACEVSGADTVIPNLERHKYIEGMTAERIAEAESLAHEWVASHLGGGTSHENKTNVGKPVR